MKTEDLIKRKLSEFRCKYQAKGSAEYLGIIAAVQRASLYTPNMNNTDIRIKWEEELKKLVKKYKEKQQDESTYKRDIQSLKEIMNRAFPPEQGRFNNQKDGYDNEFRIAHAQKSLSICLKHLWCRGELGNNIPPLCPVDGVLLKSVHNNDSWTKVNTMNQYEQHIALFKQKQAAQGYDNLSSWELITWNSPRNNNTGKSKEHVKKTASPSPVKTIVKKEITTSNAVPDLSIPLLLTYKVNRNGRQLVYPKEYSQRIYDCWKRNGKVNLIINDQEFSIKPKVRDYRCFRQKEINMWAKQKENNGTLHNKDSIKAILELHY